MLPSWKDFLQKQGAEFNDNNTVAHYGSKRRELSVALTGNIFTDLSHYGLISVYGEDAADFLQAQFTNNLSEVDELHSQLSGYCNPKGRLLASFRVFKHGDRFYICLPTTLLETVIKRLRMYVLRAQVILEDASDTFVHLGISGNEVEEDLRKPVTKLPANINAVWQSNDLLIIRVPGAHPSYEIFTNLDKGTQIWDALNVRSAPVGADAWALQDIQAGIPVIVPQTSEAFVPQMVNLHLINGVNFKKGCYPGQEIVARMQYLGKLKRRMYLARVAADVRPNPGVEIFAADRNDQAVGKIVNIAPHPDGGYVLLSVLQIHVAENERSSLHIAEPQGPELELMQLPYSFPD